MNQPAILWSAAAEGSRVSVLFFCSHHEEEGRGGGIRNLALSSGPLLASCSWLGWLFSYALSHAPAVESGPHSLAHVGNESSVTSLLCGRLPRTPTSTTDGAQARGGAPTANVRKRLGKKKKKNYT